MSRGEKAAARVAQEIVQTIYEKRLAPGVHYLSEADALSRHGVSRATFREALRFLEMQGVVHVRAGRGGGAVVQEPGWPHLASTLALLLQFANASLVEIMAARCALEPAMAALAADQATAAQLASLARLLDDAARDVGDHAGFIAAYRAFWAALAQATGNPVTAMLWPALRALVDSGGFVPNELYRQTLIGRMRDLLAAVLSRDATTAADMVGRFDRESTDRLARDYPKRVARRIAWSDLVR